MIIVRPWQTAPIEIELIQLRSRTFSTGTASIKTQWSNWLYNLDYIYIYIYIHNFHTRCFKKTSLLKAESLERGFKKKKARLKKIKERNTLIKFYVKYLVWLGFTLILRYPVTI